MNHTKNELLEYVRDNDIKFVKLTFCDLLGRHRNITILSSELESAFEKGVAIASTAVTGIDGVDLKLIPETAMLSDTPWRSHSGRVISVFCRLADIDCKPYECDPIALLERQVNKLAELGITAHVATECEFYVFKPEDEDGKIEPFDRGDYCACSPFDKCENIRKDVIMSLEDVGLKPISAHHERGPGQNEVDFERSDPITAARNFVMFKSAVKNVCFINGTVASFMPKPISDQPGSGLHIAITLSGADAKQTGAFAEGILKRYKEITCLANPTLNSYKRLGDKYKICYGANRGKAVRIFGDNIIQLRTPDSTCNIFSVLALVFAAGREGIEKNYKLRKAEVFDEYLFACLNEAVEFARGSEWLHKQIPAELDNVLDTIATRCTDAQNLKTDRDFFDFYADI